MIQAIETIYNGYRFRSRLEARWAIFFSAMGVKYEYEPEGYRLSDGTLYLPDFYLPESDTFVEIKGVLSEKDQHKIIQFMNDSGKALVLGKDQIHFQACDQFDENVFCLTEYEGESCLVKCRSCGKYYFAGLNGTYVCRCCGFYAGDNTFEMILDGDGDTGRDAMYIDWVYDPRDPINPWWPDIKLNEEGQKMQRALDKAKQARFEHGEKP